jgi:CIC family chloride channel protein
VVRHPRFGAQRVLTALRSSDTGLLMLSLAVGAGAGGGAIVFRWLIRTFTELLSGYPDYSAAGRVANPHLPGLGFWFVVLAPVVAGILYGPLVYFFAREARGHGVPEVMYAVARRGGRIAPQVAAVKALASALCIGGGGSVGREGPIVQIGSALGSTLGRIVRVAEMRMRVLVACGAAGGIAATFNAPLAGVFFAMELILADFTAQAFGMVVLSSVTASVIGRAAFGNAAFLHLPGFTVGHPIEYLLFAVLGLFAGVVGVVFTRVLYAIEDLCDRVWRGPEWLRPAVGGVLLGGLLLALPQMYGVGYPVLGNGVAGRYTLWFLLVLMAGKMVATSLTIGIGGSGGVFAPSLFIGAMFGSFYGAALHHLAPGVVGPVGAYGLIGMGAVFAGAARAPITAVIIMFELTGEYSIILPLMAAIVLATGVSNAISRDTIYTLKLRRRGIDLSRGRGVDVLHAMTAGAVAAPVDTVVAGTDTLADVAQLLADKRVAFAAVVDGAGDYLGMITAHAVADTLAAETAPALAAVDVLAPVPTILATQPLDAALTCLDESMAPALAVTDPRDGTVAGWLTHESVLLALRGRPAPEPPQEVTIATLPAG